MAAQYSPVATPAWALAWGVEPQQALDCAAAAVAVAAAVAPPGPVRAGDWVLPGWGCHQRQPRPQPWQAVSAAAGTVAGPGSAVGTAAAAPAAAAVAEPHAAAEAAGGDLSGGEVQQLGLRCQKPTRSWSQGLKAHLVLREQQRHPSLQRAELVAVVLLLTQPVAHPGC